MRLRQLQKLSSAWPRYSVSPAKAARRLIEKLPEPGDGKGCDADPEQVCPTPLDLATDRIDSDDDQRQRQKHEPQTDSEERFKLAMA